MCCPRKLAIAVCPEAKWLAKRALLGIILLACGMCVVYHASHSYAQSGDVLPVFVWVTEDASERLEFISLRLEHVRGDLVEATWQFQSTEQSTSHITMIVASHGAPSWKQFEVLCGRALVNYLVRPERDYLRTGGDPSKVHLARSLLKSHMPHLSLDLHFVTFSHPLELGTAWQEEPLLTINQHISTRNGSLLGLDKRVPETVFLIGSAIDARIARVPEGSMLIVHAPTTSHVARITVVTVLLAVALLIFQRLRRPTDLHLSLF